MNENNILPQISQFWEQNFPFWTLLDNEAYSFHSYREYGLIGHRTHEQLATSVDAMALVLYCFHGQRIKCYCAIELKTVTVSNLVQKAEGVAGRLGKFVFVHSTYCRRKGAILSRDPGSCSSLSGDSSCGHNRNFLFFICCFKHR